MSRPFWLRPLRLTEKSVVVTESVIRLAIRREPLNGLLRSSALFLLESTNADRVGVWGEETPGESVWQGYLAQSDSNGCSSEACKVNAFEAFPVEFTDSNAPLEFFAPVFPVGPREFFEGMSVVIGIPLKVDDRVLGALLIGAGRPGKLASRDAVENAAAEIAVSLFTNRLREQQERTQQSLHLREEIDNGILSGAGVQKVLGRITEAAAQRTGAQFVGVARRTDVGLQWESLSGPHLPAHSLQQFLLAVATAVFLDRDPVIQDFPSGPSAGLSIVGLPIDIFQRRITAAACGLSQRRSHFGGYFGRLPHARSQCTPSNHSARDAYCLSLTFRIHPRGAGACRFPGQNRRGESPCARIAALEK